MQANMVLKKTFQLPVPGPGTIIFNENLTQSENNVKVPITAHRTGRRWFLLSSSLTGTMTDAGGQWRRTGIPGNLTQSRLTSKIPFAGISLFWGQKML